jgi:3-oxoacyl-[acyl-carrier protein] reductase
MGDTQRLNGKIAIVTGGASGFGAGIAKRFIDEGAIVVLADLNQDAARARATDLGPSAHGMGVDVSQLTRFQGLADDVVSQFGRIDILDNNAAIPQAPTALDEMDEPTFDRILAVNAKALYVTASAVTPHMRTGGGGAILNVGSTGAVRPRPNLTWYNASKGFVITASKGMAIELAPARIRVNVLNPGAGDTPMLATFLGDGASLNHDTLLATIPLRRLCQPADMGAAAAFLCSDDASLITGVALEVDGGRCI